MIKDRFQERFFSTIIYLSYDWNVRRKTPDKFEKNGFAIMALNCLLVDTFYQFTYGLESSRELNPVTNDKGVGTHYTDFLRSTFPELFSKTQPKGSKDLADLFYEDVRCGILHSAQTKGISRLDCEGGRAVDYIENSNRVGIVVEVNEFSNELEKYFNSYIQKLKNGDQDLRSAFLKKMCFICIE